MDPKTASEAAALTLSASPCSLLAYSSLVKNGDGNEGDENKVTDVHALLAQKEKDLILAAELGKALLEKNEDLSQHNEKMAEDFSKQLEYLEQEKYRLRQQLRLMEDEYEQRILELQSDIDTLKSKLADTDTNSRLQDRERSNLVAQLTEQNQRLTSELQASASREQELASRISQLRDQVTDKRITVQDHVTHLEILREEIDLVTNRKNDLEKKVHQLIAERENLSSALDDSADKMLMLEKHTREQDCQIRGSDREMSELRSNNQVLSERLESLSRSFNSYSHTSSHGSSGSSSVQMSLLNEMEMSTSGSDSDRSLYQRRPCSQIDEEIEDIDEDGDSSLGGGGACCSSSSEGRGGGNSGLDSEGHDDSEMTYVNNTQAKQLREEMLSAYQQIRGLCSAIRHQELLPKPQQQLHIQINTTAQQTSSVVGVDTNRNKRARNHSEDSLETSSSSSSSQEDFQQTSSLQIGLLNDSVLELKGLCHNMMQNSKNCPFCNNDHHPSTLQQTETMNLKLKQREADMKKKEEEIVSLQSQLSVLKVELSAAEEQCKTLKEDIESRGISKDELVKKAWEARDAAVQRKNNAQIELAKERVASMQVNSQLLEAIQQKVELAQELENWQTDMEQLLEGQMRQRLLYGEKVTNYRAQSSSAMSTYSDTGSLENGSGNSQPGSRKTSGFLSFFQRT